MTKTVKKPLNFKKTWGRESQEQFGMPLEVMEMPVKLFEADRDSTGAVIIKKTA